MAWLYQRGKKWWIGYYDEDGKRVRRSIGDSREVAEVALKRVEAELKKPNPEYPNEKTFEPLAVPSPKKSAPRKGNRKLLTTYPAVRSVMNVRELFVRIYDDLGFEVLKSQEFFPHYVLVADEELLRAHAVVRSSDFEALDEDGQGCDYIVCWQHDWEDAPLPVLELSKQYDFLG